MLRDAVPGQHELRRRQHHAERRAPWPTRRAERLRSKRASCSSPPKTRRRVTMRADPSATTDNVATLVFEVRVDPSRGRRNRDLQPGLRECADGATSSTSPRTIRAPTVPDDPTRDVVGSRPASLRPQERHDLGRWRCRSARSIPGDRLQLHDHGLQPGRGSGHECRRSSTRSRPIPTTCWDRRRSTASPSIDPAGLERPPRRSRRPADLVFRSHAAASRTRRGRPESRARTRSSCSSSTSRRRRRSAA